MLSTPLCVLAFNRQGKPPIFAIGMLLPLLCAADLFSMWHYWRKWNVKNLYYLIPGVVLGVYLGVRWMIHITPRQLNLAVGSFAVVFVIFQFVKEQIFKAEGTFAPSHWSGFPFGLAAGVTSSFANGAGPVVSMFLIPQKMPKEIFVGTTILVFTWINLIKLVWFIPKGIVTSSTAFYSLLFSPFIPVGVALGVWLNRKVPEKMFQFLVYALTLLTGLELLFR